MVRRELTCGLGEQADILARPFDATGGEMRERRAPKDAFSIVWIMDFVQAREKLLCLRDRFLVASVRQEGFDDLGARRRDQVDPGQTLCKLERLDRRFHAARRAPRREAEERPYLCWGSLLHKLECLVDPLLDHLGIRSRAPHAEADGGFVREQVEELATADTVGGQLDRSLDGFPEGLAVVLERVRLSDLLPEIDLRVGRRELDGPVQEL